MLSLWFSTFSIQLQIMDSQTEEDIQAILSEEISVKSLTDAGFTGVVLSLSTKDRAIRLLLEHQIIWCRKRSIDQLIHGIKKVDRNLTLEKLVNYFPIKTNIKKEDIVNLLEHDDSRSLVATRARAWLVQFILAIGEGEISYLKSFFSKSFQIIINRSL